MKKIVGIIAAVAMATSVFAADASAKVVLTSNLFKYDAGTKKVNVFGVAEGNQGWNPLLSLSVSGDKAGATIKFYDVDANGENTGDTRADGWKIWFKPAEILKFNIGQFDTNLNQEKIDWSHTESGIDKFGFALSLTPVDGLSFDLFLRSNLGSQYDKPLFWLEKADGTDAKVGDVYFKAAYGADFGTISAMFRYGDNFDSKKMMFGAGYSGSVDSVSYFVNILGYMNDGFAGLRVEPFVSASIDSIGISAFIPVTYVGTGAKMFSADGSNWRLAQIGYSGAPKDGKVFLGTTLKVTFPLGPLGGYVYVKENDWTADNFSVIVKPGFTVNVGSCAIDFAIEATIQDKMALSVPVVFTVAW